ncbi:hypothetical protein [Methanoculleus chikugoensis]|uniref:hypothetical protein n=1 Tax=Methanoculleus chikugoensis TaxID=118126 RepID=UPI000A4AD1B3|nr:hypothetical protein [Methanoculleus chikugoensis]
MAFIYYGQGVSSLYRDFVERLMSQLALRGGTEITHQEIGGDASSRMDVRHIGEEGRMEITVDRENVRVSYTVNRERKEVKKGIAGAITGGAGIGVSSAAYSERPGRRRHRRRSHRGRGGRRGVRRL